MMNLNIEHVTKSTVYRYARNGKLSYKVVDGKRYYSAYETYKVAKFNILRDDEHSDSIDKPFIDKAIKLNDSLDNDIFIIFKPRCATYNYKLVFDEELNMVHGVYRVLNFTQYVKNHAPYDYSSIVHELNGTTYMPEVKVEKMNNLKRNLKSVIGINHCRTDQISTNLKARHYLLTMYEDNTIENENLVVGFYLGTDGFVDGSTCLSILRSDEVKDNFITIKKFSGKVEDIMNSIDIDDYQLLDDIVDNYLDKYLDMEKIKSWIPNK